MSQSLPEWLSSIDPLAYEGCDAVLFQKVRQAYETPGRWYHTWQHIEACMELFETGVFDQPRVVFLALLFHDAVYVPGRKDNEAKSAELANSLIEIYSNIPVSERQDITAMIAHTASHHENDTLVPDAKKLIDVDLAILGAPWPEYDAYAKNVRREFCPSVVSEREYLSGRLHFLHALQNRSSIFLTDEMRISRENKARENLAREVALLQAELSSAD